MNMASKNLAKYLFDEKMVKKNWEILAVLNFLARKTALHTKVHMFTFFAQSEYLAKQDPG